MKLASEEGASTFWLQKGLRNSYVVVLASELYGEFVWKASLLLIRKGQEIKTHRFKLHNKLVTEPFIDTIK